MFYQTAEQVGIKKIERHNLGPRIIKLMTEDGLNGTQVAERLKAKGFPITQSTVSRWLKEQKGSSSERVNQIFAEHVEKELPKDLEALENLEKLCLEWSKEEISDKVERILTWRRVNDAFDELLQMVLDAGRDEKARIETAKSIVKRCMLWIYEDDQNQRQRLLSIKQAQSIIETKLRFAGVIDADADGNIIIKGYGQPAATPSDPGTGGGGEKKPGVFRVIGGRDA